MKLLISLSQEKFFHIAKTRVAKLYPPLLLRHFVAPLEYDYHRPENVGKCFSREFSSGRTRRRRAPLEGSEFNDTPEGGFRVATLTLRESSMMVGAKRCSAYWIAYTFILIRNILFEQRILEFENHWNVLIKICKIIISINVILILTRKEIYFLYKIDQNEVLLEFWK